MTTYAATMATAVLLASLTFDCDVWRLRSAASERDAAPPVSRTYGTGGLDRRKAYADNPSYDSGGVGLGDDDDDGDYAETDSNSRDPSQREDQLDQDDPGNIGFIASIKLLQFIYKNSLCLCEVDQP